MAVRVRVWVVERPRGPVTTRVGVVPRRAAVIIAPGPRVIVAKPAAIAPVTVAIAVSASVPGPGIRHAGQPGRQDQARQYHFSTHRRSPLLDRQDRGLPARRARRPR